MAVRKKKSELATPLLLNESLIEQIVEAVRKHLNKYAETICEVIEESEDRCLTVNFGVPFDFSETAPSADVMCRFSTSVTDKIKIQCDDPNQLTFTSTFAGDVPITTTTGETNPEDPDLPSDPQYQPPNLIGLTLPETPKKRGRGRPKKDKETPATETINPE